MTSAIILKDSTNWLGSRLTTLVLTYPRYIHAEFMTHRVLSKNSASSRAIPLNKMIANIQEDTVYPIWTKTAKGMQGELIDDEILIESLDKELDKARDNAINSVLQMNMGLVHKQNLNRYLEPFQYIKVICTGTEWENFFNLRIHKDAQPEIRELALEIADAMSKSTPEYLEPRQWHLPFGDRINHEQLIEQVGFLVSPTNVDNKISSQELQISVARCARISYNTFNGEIDYKKDLELYNRLVNNNPKHLSPTEHQARVPKQDELVNFSSGYGYDPKASNKKFHRGKYVSNLNGWIQYRKLIENETYG